MDYLNELKSFGLPGSIDNARAKHYVMYDTVTIATGITQYNMFVNSSLSSLTRNRLLPISNNEVVAIHSINCLLSGVIDVSTANNLEIFTRAYLQISVDDRIKAKIPMMEIMSFSRTFSRINVSTASKFDRVERTRKFQYPIILNSSSNVQLRIELPASTASIYNNFTLDFEFNCVKYDKLSSYDIDLRKGSNFERLSFSMYDVNVLTYNARTTVELFSTANKPATDFSKNFPLGDKEVFSIENIEIGVYPRGTIVTEWSAFIRNLKQSVLQIFVDDIEFFNYRAKDMLTLFLGDGSGDTTSEYVTNKGLTLLSPLTIPASSRVKVSLEYPALTLSGTAGTSYFIVDLKGTLQRTVA